MQGKCDGSRFIYTGDVDRIDNRWVNNGPGAGMSPEQAAVVKGGCTGNLNLISPAKYSIRSCACDEVWDDSKCHIINNVNARRSTCYS